MTTLQLKYGEMKIEVEPADPSMNSGQAGFQRVARYSLAQHSRLAGKTLTSRGKVYKRESSAAKDVEKFAAQQQRALG